jgi:hypothetical protein
VFAGIAFQLTLVAGGCLLFIAGLKPADVEALNGFQNP